MFAQIDRKQTHVNENKWPLSSLNCGDKAVFIFLFSQKNSEDKLVHIIPGVWEAICSAETREARVMPLFSSWHSSQTAFQVKNSFKTVCIELTHKLVECYLHLVLDNTAGVWGFQEHSNQHTAAHTYEVRHECENGAKLLLFLLPWWWLSNTWGMFWGEIWGKMSKQFMRGWHLICTSFSPWRRD